MALPKELEPQVEAVVRGVVRERRLGRLRSVGRFALERGVRQGLEQGLQQGVLEGLVSAIVQTLELRFGAVSASVLAVLCQVSDGEALRRLYAEAVRAGSLAEFLQALERETAPSEPTS